MIKFKKNKKIKIRNFYFHIYFKNSFEEFLANLESELKCASTGFVFDPKTIYLSGKQIVQLKNEQLCLLFRLINKYVNPKKNIEYSCEYFFNNKNNLNFFLILKKYKINRIIWKVNTFNRKNKGIINFIKDVTSLNFLNFSIELAYDNNKENIKNIINNLNVCLQLNAPHISYESKNKYINYEFKKNINSFLAENGYINYEFFSYAKNNYFSKYVLSYYNLENLFGFGIRSSGFFKFKNEFYIIKSNSVFPFKGKIEKIDFYEYLELFLIQGLMKREGVKINDNFKEFINIKYGKTINKLVKEGMLIYKNSYLLATEKGWALLNDVLIDIININKKS